ncbi:c-type cytochrome [Roseivivax sp. CAU 1753]
MRPTAIAMSLTTCVALLGCAPEQDTAYDDYANLCAGCHGLSGQGDGPMAESLAVQPSDLTRIAERNGGTFSRFQVMSKIHGYSGTMHDFSAMPGFQGLMESPTVLVEHDDGTVLPTPKRIVALTAYLESLQI